MLTLYLLRHAQTDASRERRFSGLIDARLSPVGHQMADAFAEAYRSTPWSAIYCSPLRRALDTAAPLARQTDMPVEIDESLREIAYGEWEGLLEADVRERWPEAYARWTSDPASGAPPGGETGAEVANRVVAAIGRIHRAHPSGHVLVVSHKSALRLAICALVGIDLRHFRARIDQPVAALSVFELDDGGALFKRLGDVAHLPMSLRDLPGS